MAADKGVKPGQLALWVLAQGEDIAPIPVPSGAPPEENRGGGSDDDSQTPDQIDTALPPDCSRRSTRHEHRQSLGFKIGASWDETSLI